MIEPTVITYLSGKLSVPVSGGVPASPPEKFVTVEKTGGSVENLIRSSTLAIQSWAPSIAEAAALNDEVIDAMSGILILGDISSVELNSDYNFTDTTRNHPRYQAVFDIVHY